MERVRAIYTPKLPRLCMNLCFILHFLHATGVDGSSGRSNCPESTRNWGRCSGWQQGSSDMWTYVTAGSDSLKIKQSPSASWCQNLWMRPEKARMLLFKARLHGVTVSYILRLHVTHVHPCSTCFRTNRWILQDRSVSISKWQNKINAVVVSMACLPTTHRPFISYQQYMQLSYPIFNYMICINMRWPLVCQNDLWRKFKPEFAEAKFFFGESFAKVLRYDCNIHGFLKIKFIYGDDSRKFGESFDKAWRKTAFSWKLGWPKLLTCYVLFPGRQEAGEPLVSVGKYIIHYDLCIIIQYTL